MSNFNNIQNQDPFKFKFSFDYFPTQKPKELQEFEGPPIWFFVTVAIFAVLWQIFLIWNKCCKREEVNAKDTQTFYSNYHNRQMHSRSIPTALMVSERSAQSYMSNPLVFSPHQNYVPSASQVDYAEPQVHQPSAPRIIEESAPNYDNPPNYDEALEIIKHQKQGN